MIKFIKSLFNRRIKMIDRTHFILKHENRGYLFEFEFLYSPPIDIVVYTTEVYFFDKKEKGLKLSDEEKKILLPEVKDEFESMGMKVELHPGS